MSQHEEAIAIIVLPHHHLFNCHILIHHHHLIHFTHYHHHLPIHFKLHHHLKVDTTHHLFNLHHHLPLPITFEIFIFMLSFLVSTIYFIIFSVKDFYAVCLQRENYFLFWLFRDVTRTRTCL